MRGTTAIVVYWIDSGGVGEGLVASVSRHSTGLATQSFNGSTADKVGKNSIRNALLHGATAMTKKGKRFFQHQTLPRYGVSAGYGGVSQEMLAAPEVITTHLGIVRTCPVIYCSI